MAELDLTVAITTFNRARLVSRAVESVVNQHWPTLEIMVVDDASTDNTQEVVESTFPRVRYIRQEKNSGVCAARNLALQKASRPWLLFLDDDDTLISDALARLAMLVSDFPNASKYPVLEFACSNGEAASPFMIATLADHLEGRVRGDFVPLIQKDYFRAEGLAYPPFRMPAEGLLWLKVADKYGIPTWAEKIGNVHADAHLRVTSASYQLLHARELAEIQEHALQELGETLGAQFPDYYQRRCLGAATYRILANQKSLARAHLRHLLARRISALAIGLWTLTFLPQACVRRCFEVYRHAANSVTST
jgi:glycosyltransferase involved in cell wall biosynthesis